MTGHDVAKAGTAAAGAALLLGGVYTEPRDPAAATGLYTLGVLLIGVWLAQAVIDWWRDRDGR